MDDLEALLRRGRCYVELGVALTPAAPSTLPGATTAARTVTVQLVHGTRTVEARVANVGQGAGRGIFAPILPGDELLVLFPGGEPNRAVVLGGLGSAKSPNPTENLGLAMLLLHPGGVLLSSVDGGLPHGIVHGQFLAELSNLLSALTAFMTACSIASIPQAAEIKTAALDFLADSPALAFVGAVAASAQSGVAPGVGGPPYATALHKVTP